MGADIKQLRVRIKSVTSTQHLTKAMGLVASSKIRKSIDAMNRSKEYAHVVSQTISELAQCGECEKSPYITANTDGAVQLIVIAGDRGLAGGYNSNVFRLLRDFPDANILPIGKRACERYAGKLQLAETFSYTESKKMVETLCEDYKQGAFGKLGIVYTKHHSMMSQEVAVRWVLPLERTTDAFSASAIFEPDALTILNEAVPEYITGVLMACVRESFASEVAARRVAMDSADKNAREMLSSLRLDYNRARQGAITQEITEIVAGSNT